LNASESVAIKNATLSNSNTAFISGCVEINVTKQNLLRVNETNTNLLV